MEAGCVAPANGVIKQVFNVEEWNSRNELVAQGFIGLLVETVSLLVDKVLAVEFSDVGLCRSPWMVRLLCCILYTSDAADDDDTVELGVRRSLMHKTTSESVARDSVVLHH